MSQKVDTENIKRVFTEAGCFGLASLVEYLESQEEGFSSLHLSLDLTDVIHSAGDVMTLKGIPIGGPTQDPISWCQEFAEAMPQLFANKTKWDGVKLLDKAVGEAVEIFKLPSHALSEQEKRRLNG